MTDWIKHHRPQPDASVRLFCFHHAGGGASLYAGWGELAVSDLEICPVLLPGREQRMAEAAHADMAPLVDALVAALQPWMDMPFAFFGHSMGARVALALSLALARRGGPQPCHLIVSANQAPQHPVSRPPMHRLDDAAFLAELRAMGGTPEELLRSADLMKMVLPTMRADFRVIETYRPDTTERLGCDLTAFGGRDDDRVEDAGLRAWAELTDGRFACRAWPGGHFYLKDQSAAVVNVVSASIFRSLAAPPVATQGQAPDSRGRRYG